MTPNSPSDKAAPPDIRIIKILSAEIINLIDEANNIRQDLYAAQCNVQRLEGAQQANERAINQAKEAREQYAHKWSKLLRDDYWKDY